MERGKLTDITQGTTMANPTSTITDLATIVQHITNVQPGNYGPLAHTLKVFSADEQRDSLLGGLLPGTQDPLTLLNPRINTLGYLYILCVSDRCLSSRAGFMTVSVGLRVSREATE